MDPSCEATLCPRPSLTRSRSGADDRRGDSAHARNREPMTPPPVAQRDPRSLWRIIIAVALMLLVAWIAVSFVARRPPAPPPAASADRDLPALDKIYFEDVVQEAYDGSMKLWILSADELVHRKRKVGPLTINPIKEVEMTGVRIEIDRSAVMPVDVGAPPDRAAKPLDRAVTPPDRAATPHERVAASLGLDLPIRSEERRVGKG